MSGWLSIWNLRLTLSVAIMMFGQCCVAQANPRVVLMNFICEDNSYRSTVAATNFTALLQADLSADTGFEWVERAELNRMEEEMKVAGLGLIDRVESIRGGRWVKADWGVLGRISTNSPEGRSLWMEVVDLQRADVLASTNLSLVPRQDVHFAVGAEDFVNVSRCLGVLLNQARLAQVRNTEKEAVALLFFSASGSLGGSKELANLQTDIRSELGKRLSHHPSLHLVQFQRAGEATDEAELVLGGLAIDEPNAWERVADHYLWGETRVVRWREFDPESGRSHASLRVELNLNILNGGGGMRTLSLAVTNPASSGEAARELAASVMDSIASGSHDADAVGVRSQASAAIVDHGLRDAREWSEVVPLLETACFFDPGNRLARELWVRVRWGREGLDSSPNEFFHARRRSEAWKRHVDQFGFESVCPAAPYGLWATHSVESEFVLSAWRPFEMLSLSQYDQARWGVPRDAGGEELRGWQRQFAKEFYSRMLAARDDERWLAKSRDMLYRAFSMNGNEFVLEDARLRQRVLDRLWPHVLESQRANPAEFDAAHLRGFRVHFNELGQAGRDRDYLEQLNAIARTIIQKARSRPVPLPRASDLDEDEHESR